MKKLTKLFFTLSVLITGCTICTKQLTSRLSSFITGASTAKVTYKDLFRQHGREIWVYNSDNSGRVICKITGAYREGPRREVEAPVDILPILELTEQQLKTTHAEIMQNRDLTMARQRANPFTSDAIPKTIFLSQLPPADKDKNIRINLTFVNDGQQDISPSRAVLASNL